MSYWFPESPRIFKTGDILTPDDINHNYQYYIELGEEIATKRYYKWSTTYQFGTLNNGYSSADTSGLLEFNIPEISRRYPGDAVTTWYIDRIYVTADAITGNVDVMLNTGTAAYTLASLDSTTLTSFNGTRYTLNQSIAQPKIYLSGATFTTTRLLVQVHFRSDRFDQGEPTVPSDILVNDFDELDVTTLNTNLTTLTTYLNAVVGTSKASRATLLTWHDITNAIPAYQRRIDVTASIQALPKIGTSQIIGAKAYAECAVGTAQTVTFTLQDSSGTTIDTVVVSMSGSTSGSQNKTFAVTGNLDRVVVSTSGATNITKAYLYLLYA